MLPDDFRMAITRHLVGGAVQVLTGDGPRVCGHDCWIVRGPDGSFSVLKAAAFETLFEEYTPPAAASPVPAPVVPEEFSRVKRAYNRRENANA